MVSFPCDRPSPGGEARSRCPAGALISKEDNAGLTLIKPSFPPAAPSHQWCTSPVPPRDYPPPPPPQVLVSQSGRPKTHLQSCENLSSLLTGENARFLLLGRVTPRLTGAVRAPARNILHSPSFPLRATIPPSVKWASELFKGSHGKSAKINQTRGVWVA